MSANPSRLGLKILAVLVVTAAAAAAVWFTFRPVATVAIVKPGPATKIVPGTVVVTAEKTSEIKSEAEGRLVESQLLPGKVVKEGETLAQIDHSDIDIEIQHWESELAAMKKTIELSDATADRNWKTTEEAFKETERLHKLQSLSDVAFTQAQRAHESATQQREVTAVANARQVENLENKLQTLRLQRTRMTVTAPFDGVISQVSANKGDLINNKQALATLITLTRLVTGKISEENFADVQVGQKARVNFLGYHDEMFDATVSKKLPTAEEATQRYLVYLDVAIAPERLLPNLTGEVAVKISEHEAKALVPRRAIFDGTFVYVVESGRVAKRKVELGYTSLTVAEVTNGLQAGDQVIVDNLDQFAEGDRVRTVVAK